MNYVILCVPHSVRSLSITIETDKKHECVKKGYRIDIYTQYHNLCTLVDRWLKMKNTEIEREREREKKRAKTRVLNLLFGVFERHPHSFIYYDLVSCEDLTQNGCHFRSLTIILLSHREQDSRFGY